MYHLSTLCSTLSHIDDVQKGRFEDSICMFHTIINSLKESSEKIPNYVLGAAFHNLGVVQMWAGRYEESLENLLHAINVRTRILGPLHALVAVRFKCMCAPILCLMRLTIYQKCLHCVSLIRYHL